MYQIKGKDLLDNFVQTNQLLDKGTFEYGRVFFENFNPESKHHRLVMDVPICSAKWLP